MNINKNFFQDQGYVVVEKLIEQDEVSLLLADYKLMVSGEIPMKGFDGLITKVSEQNNKVVQIGNPSDQYTRWRQYSYFQRSLEFAKLLMGEDMEYKYDQIIYKPPYNSAETAWHQDGGYWEEGGGKYRNAVTCWLALTPAFLENGGMKFIPRSHMGEIKVHQPLGNEKGINESLGILDVDETTAVTNLLFAGDASFHHSRILHGANANNTQLPRCALITHFEARD